MKGGETVESIFDVIVETLEDPNITKEDLRNRIYSEDHIFGHVYEVEIINDSDMIIYEADAWWNKKYCSKPCLLIQMFIAEGQEGL